MIQIGRDNGAVEGLGTNGVPGLPGRLAGVGIGFVYVGGSAALDLLNTQMLMNGREIDLLRGWADAVEWAVGAGVIDMAGASTLREERAGEHGEQWARLIELRRVVRVLVEHGAGMAQDRPMGERDSAVRILNTMAREAPAESELGWDERGLRRAAYSGAWTGAMLLGAVARDGVRLLMERDLTRLRTCAGATCVLWFYDSSRNGTRRWCSMSACGNRSKAKDYYRRRRSGAGS